jgi:hypothetical protein
MLGEFNLPTREQKMLHDQQNPKQRKWEDFDQPIKKPIENMLNIRVAIKDYLERFPNLKDDDVSLMATVWEYEIPKILPYMNIHSMPTVSFLSLLADKKLSNPETIRRTRQKLQQEWPHLRGSKWEARHQHSKVVKEIIINSPEFYPGGTP